MMRRIFESGTLRMFPYTSVLIRTNKAFEKITAVLCSDHQKFDQGKAPGLYPFAPKRVKIHFFFHSKTHSLLSLTRFYYSLCTLILQEGAKKKNSVFFRETVNGSILFRQGIGIIHTSGLDFPRLRCILTGFIND